MFVNASLPMASLIGGLGSRDSSYIFLAAFVVSPDAASTRIGWVSVVINSLVWAAAPSGFVYAGCKGSQAALDTNPVRKTPGSMRVIWGMSPLVFLDDTAEVTMLTLMFQLGSISVAKVGVIPSRASGDNTHEYASHNVNEYAYQTSPRYKSLRTGRDVARRTNYSRAVVHPSQQGSPRGKTVRLPCLRPPPPRS